MTDLSRPLNCTRDVLEVLEQLEMLDRGNARLEGLKAQLDALPPDDRQVLYDLLFAATSPTLTFGIKDLPDADEQRVLVGPEVFYPQLFQMLRMLRDRLLSGNNAREAVRQFQNRCSQTQLKWVQRILRQDLRLDIGAKEINKALGFKLVPLFEVPLATDWNKVKLEKVLAQSRDWVMQPKLDGGRCVAILPANGGPVELLSRTGKAWKNFNSIKKHLQAFNNCRGDDPTVDGNQTLILDGEVVSRDENGKIDFQQIQKTMMRNDGVEVGKLEFVVFDAAFAEDWYAPKDSYRLRLGFARKMVEMIHVTNVPPPVSIIPTEWWIYQARHGYENEIEVNEADLRETVSNCAMVFVEQGYEGLMLRAADLPVENKRGKFLLKVKTFQDAEAEMIGVSEGTGKLQGSLGAIICQLPVSKEDRALGIQGKTFEVGSGFSEKQRQQIWKDFTGDDIARSAKMMGQIVNFKFFEKTDAGIPRFPIFRGFRSPDDIGPQASEE